MSERKMMKRIPLPTPGKGKHPNADWASTEADDAAKWIVDGKPHPMLNRAQRRKVAKMMNLDP